MRDPRTRGASRRRQLLHIPEEGDNVTYTNSQRRVILTLVNSVFDDGHRALFSRLAMALAPGCEPAYVTHPTPQAFRPRVVFVWRPLPAAEQSLLRAQHSVFFSIDTTPPLSVAHLTFTLLHFTYTAIQTHVTADYNFDPRRLPRMTHLAYHITPGPVYGIAYFDNLHHAFADASAQGLQLTPNHARPLTVITTWPPDVHELLLWAHYHSWRLMTRCNRLCRMMTFV
ncbi:hypothetical protein GSI_02910 [Ganoderma sinense ZZ0214-1]|uniref:Uncharacterized protein n=1 Tax=Ganoderma sinense ZZ0214-1 TaxID=1077348 RepID=A0A2G8SMY3_9APHY|nr:hypothetical protein GSI_02910 [Ganoderma sinense ZZ0214-1]